MKKREVSVPELVLGEQGLVTPSIVTGVSGAGKDFLMANLSFPNDLVITYLDSVSKRVGDKWIAPTDLLRTSDIVCGLSDNLSDVGKVLRASHPGKPLTMYCVEPSPHLFRMTNSAKAHDHAEKHGLALTSDEDPWLVGWLSKSKFSDKGVLDYLSAKRELFVHHIAPDELVIVRNVDPRSNIVNGWHKRTNGKGGAL